MKEAVLSRCFGLVLLVVVSLVVVVPEGGLTAAQSRSDSDGVIELLDQLHGLDPAKRLSALKKIEIRGGLDVVPALIMALRFVPAHQSINETLAKLVGAQHGPDWFDWMLWLEAHPEIRSFPGFEQHKADVMAKIDPAFGLFLKAGSPHEIRLEEVVWGGVRKDGIPALTNPKQILAREATYLEPDELVFGISINGDARAYPLRIMDWHEMFNDVIGGVPVSLAYCTLCGSGILFETKVPNRQEPFVFGSSGFLYRSNKLMYDQQTHSLWNQFTGHPVVGPLSGAGIKLKVRPVIITSWEEWLARHPRSKVLSLNTGYGRNYLPGLPYGDYFASPDLMFPALISDARLKPKDYVFVLRGGGKEKMWPLSEFEGGAVINADVGDQKVVLLGHAKTRSVRAYQRGGQDFRPGESDSEIKDKAGRVWRVEEEGISGPRGELLARLPGHVAYWFAWQGFKK